MKHTECKCGPEDVRQAAEKLSTYGLDAWRFWSEIQIERV